MNVLLYAEKDYLYSKLFSYVWNFRRNAGEHRLFFGFYLINIFDTPNVTPMSFCLHKNNY